MLTQSKRASRLSLLDWLQETFGTDQLWVSTLDLLGLTDVLDAGRRPAKVTRIGADPTWKASWRFIRSWVCHNHKAYYSYVILTAMSIYTFWWNMCVGYYRRRNHHVSKNEIKSITDIRIEIS